MNGDTGLHNSFSVSSSEKPSIWASVIMPTYSGARFLRAALESVIAQNDSGVELIVIDDGSTDGTLEILENYRSRLQLELVRRSHSGNWVENTNAGIKLARGEFVSFLHQDDLWLPNRIRTLRELVHRHPKATVFVQPTRFVDSNGTCIGMWNCPFPRRNGPVSRNVVFPRLIVQNFIGIPAPLIRRETLLSVGPLDTTLWFTADWDLWLRLASAGEWVYSREPLSCFRIHSDAQTAKRTDAVDFEEQYRQIQARFFPLLPQFAPNSKAIRAVAQCSAKINVALARRKHRQEARLLGVLVESLKLGPLGWFQLFSYSRLVERIVPRLRALSKAQATLGASPKETVSVVP